MINSARLFLVALAIAALCSLAGAARAQQLKVPFNPQNKEVNDVAALLTPQQRADLTSRIQDLERTDGTQLAILIISTLRGEDIFNFAQRTANEWGIGQKDKNNGALFVLVTQDRKARIHVGYGLEGALPDALAKRILATEATPRFREGKYYEGLSAATNAMIQAVRGEYKPPAQRQENRGQSSGGSPLSGLLVMAIIMFLLWKMSRGGRGGPGGRGGGRRFGGPGVIVLPDIWTAGRGGSWSGGGGGFGGGGGGGFGGGSFGGGGAGDSW